MFNRKKDIQIESLLSIIERQEAVSLQNQETIKQLRSMLGLKDQHIKELTKLLKYKLEYIKGRTVHCEYDYDYLSAKSRILKVYKVRRWQDIPVTKFNEVHAIIDEINSLEDIMLIK